MFKAIKDNKIIAINETGIFPCLVHDTIIEDNEHSISDYIEYLGEFVLKTEAPEPVDDGTILNPVFKLVSVMPAEPEENTIYFLTA